MTGLIHQGCCKVILPHPSNSPLLLERGEPCRLPALPLAILERGRGKVNCTTLTLQQPYLTHDSHDDHKLISPNHLLFVRPAPIGMEIAVTKSTLPKTCVDSGRIDF